MVAHCAFNLYNMSMKICTMCNLPKRTSSFYGDSRTKNGIRSNCKKCYGKRYKYVHSKQKNENWKKYASSEKGIVTLLLSNARDRAKRTGKSFSIDKEWLLENIRKGKCELSGMPFIFEKGVSGNYRANPFGPSIDKIDPSLGYTKENCRIVCFCVNMARSDWGDDNLIKMCEAILKMKCITWKE